MATMAVWQRLYIVLLLMLEVCSAMTQHNLTFMLVTSFGQFGFNSSGIIPAADLALEDINNDSSILQGYKLMYDKVRDSQCDRGKSLDRFFEGIRSDPIKLAVVGCGCSVATEPVAEICHTWNISQISYASTSPSLSDRTRFKRYFRNTINMNIAYSALHSIMNHFNWTRIAVLTQDESLFLAAESTFRREVEPAGITVESRMFKSDEDPITAVQDLFSENIDYRVFVLNSYSGQARKIICYAQRNNFTYPKYAWIAYDWYPRRWWTHEESNIEVGCSDQELAKFLQKVISLRVRPVLDDKNATTDAGITPLDFEDEYKIRADTGGYGTINHGIGVYDVIWVLAIALNRTISMINSNNVINATGCQDVPGSLVPLEHFNYTNERIGCLIQWNIQRTNFSGLTGHIQFDENGTRIHSTVQLLQYMYQGGDSVIRYRFASLRGDNNFTFVYEPGIEDSDIFPSNPPHDGTPRKVIHTVQTWITVLFSFLALLGIVFGGTCFLFTVIFRNRKTVRLTSPKLNCLIIVGSMSMYLSVIFHLIPATNPIIVEAMCTLKHWLFSIGYSLAFGAVLAKMWRVFHIFHNPKPKKNTMKDWMLIAITLSICGIVILLLIFETAVPYLRGIVIKERDSENPYGKDSLGIREQYFVLVCYEASSPNFFWKIFIFVYLGVLQILGILLAFQTRKVKIPGLKDSKFVAAVVYISSIVLVVLALVTFALRTHININAGIQVAGIFIMTTMILVLIFVPKMILFCRDPRGETVTTVTPMPSVMATITAQAQANQGQILSNKELKGKVSSMAKTIEDKDKTIAELLAKVQSLTQRNEGDCESDS